MDLIKKGRAGTPAQPDCDKSNITNNDITSHDSTDFPPCKYGQSLANLYCTDIGSFESFYRLFQIQESKYAGTDRKIFLEGFFDTIEILRLEDNHGK
jgi:hypothetical protein